MIEEIALISAAETAALLRKYLGPARQWRDFLSDCIRERTQLHGHVLMPYAVRKNGHDARRPLYSGRDVVAFIRAARASDPTLGPTPIAPTRFEVDTRPGLPWTVRVAEPVSRGGATA